MVTNREARHKENRESTGSIYKENKGNGESELLQKVKGTSSPQHGEEEGQILCDICMATNKRKKGECNGIGTQ